jgi:hypothetical protein
MVLEGQRLFVTRLTVGLAQGLALYLLYLAQDNKGWPATNGLVFGPLLMVWLFPPVILELAIGQIDLRRAAIWAAAAVMIMAGLGFYDIWSAWPQDWGFGLNASPRPHLIPSAELFFFGGAGLFIAHALIIGGHIDHLFKASYETHFDVAWKLAVQLALAGVFVGAFWLLLWLGAGLFNLIKLDFFQRLIRHQWFSIPVTALAIAGALHLTDIRPALVRGARTLLLTLLSWLLPLITLISAGFLASLPFTGLQPLWSFGHASALLLTAAAGLIILINAAHQDGHAERMPAKVLRYSGTAAAVLPVPLVAIATYALFLRIQQYGWSADRVIVAATIIVAWSYAAGYAWAAVSPGAWMTRIENWNFGTALLILAVLIALFTPVAKPTRIAVADQVARLESGKIQPAKFDFHYLRWQGGHYGLVALTALSHNNQSLVRDSAQIALKETNQYAFVAVPSAVWTTRVTVYPAGQTLPQDFLATDWAKATYAEHPSCMNGNQHCSAVLADVDGDGAAEILLFIDNLRYVNDIQVFRRNPSEGNWHLNGNITIPPNCTSILDALRQNRFTTAPESHPWQQIQIGGLTLHVTDWRLSAGPASDGQRCPA